MRHRAGAVSHGLQSALSRAALAGSTRGQRGFKNLKGLVCSTLRPPDRPVRSHEVFLDGADGFEQKTVCRCHLVIEFAREDILTTRDRVSPARQAAIKRKLREIFGL